MSRENVIRDQIIAIDRTLLTLTPLSVSDKSHREILERIEKAMDAMAQVLDNKINTVAEKVAELKSYRDTTTGRSSGYSAIYGWAIAGISVLISVILLANTLIVHK